MPDEIDVQVPDEVIIIDTWETRLMDALGSGGYDLSVRRSIQAVVLFEAHRIVAGLFNSMRPYQRKLAYHDMVLALAKSLSFLRADQQAEILWRTGTSKEPVNFETAWKRRILLLKDLDHIRDAIDAHCENLSHSDAVDKYLQLKVEATSGGNNAVLCYRLYYRGTELDPSFPAPNPPKEVYVANEKPSMIIMSSVTYPNTPEQGQPPSASKVMLPVAATNAEAATTTTTTATTPAISKSKLSAWDRERLLEEVKEHLALLKEFEGSITEEEIRQRKRELFLAMPPPPPPAKRMNNTESSTT